MSYTALYRKWRPKDFKDVIGQEHIVQTLKNQIKANRIAHAYLFCGTRGTGKTSTAKIFAKAVNCMEPEEGEPCNHCKVCNGISEGNSMNIIEIDAASNNGVDNIREIREEVKYSPTEGKYKVYIIDEVHMLSTGAFNALLKTLEEPPAHVIFILATTDPQKIPATILSRCQRFDFRRISVKQITETLMNFMEEEKIDIEEKAVGYIARIADGSMRDALSILDQCISFYLGKQITLEMVLDVLGAVDTSVFYGMAQALQELNSGRCMELVEEIMMQGRDLTQFVLDLIVHFRNLLVLRSSGDSGTMLDMSEENMASLKKQAQQIPGNTLLRYIRIFSELETQLKYASQGRILLEVALMKLCQPMMDESYDALFDRIKQLEQKIADGVQVRSTGQSEQAASVQEQPMARPKPKAVPEDIKNGIELWNDIKQKYDAPTRAILNDTQAGYLEDAVYYIVCPNGFTMDLIEDRKKEFVEKLGEITGKTFQVKPILITTYQQRYNELYGGENRDQYPEEDQEIQKVIKQFSNMGIPIEEID